LVAVLLIFASAFLKGGSSSTPPVAPAIDPDAVRAQAKQRTPPPPLWKPEPAHLLRAATGLGLTSRQVKRIAAIDAEWRRTRDAIEGSMRGEVSGLEDARRSEPQLRGGLQGYSELSRRFDAERSRFWQEALTTLTPKQRERAARPGGIS
jgi:hypothetical protein